MLFSRQPEAQGGLGGAGPAEGREEGAAVDPWVGEAEVAAPLNREEGELPHNEERQETGRKTPDPLTEEVGTPRPQETEGTVLALGAIPPAGDVSQGGHDHQVEEGRAEGTLSVVAPARPHGKGPARPGAPTREGGGRMAWGQDPVIWPNPDDPEGRARFVLDDPSESYL